MNECVKVVVRCRPLNDKELEADYNIVISVDSIQNQILLRQTKFNTTNPQKIFTFDHVYDTDATNEEIYDKVVSPLVKSTLLGYNGCVFAFGQTSCGKTFSMQGISKPPCQRGVMSRTFEQIFQHINNADITYYVIRTSYLEIYNEEIRDLLYQHNMRRLELKEHPEKGVYVKDLTAVDVTCIEEMEEVLEVGSWNRVLGATAQNPDSSRSHCIFMVEFEFCYQNEIEGKEQIRRGRLNLVDLAGSERQHYTKCEGERFKEATKINLSLSALGNVISALVNVNSKHIPYRASKLTRLLQDSLGGNSRTLMIACISPGANNYGETLSTLRYANRAKNIKNRPRMNEDCKDTLMRQYEQEIKMLRHLITNQIKMNGDTMIEPISESLENTQEPLPIYSTLLISKKERLAYEKKITGLQTKYDFEQMSRERLESCLKAMKSEYETYRLKHEYEMKKLHTDYKLKLGSLKDLVIISNDDESDESAYISGSSDTDLSSYDSAFNERHQGKILTSPIIDNAHLWSYQWLKCYCENNKKNFSRSLYFLNQDLNSSYQCMCTEQIKNVVWNEKECQTCDRCINRSKISQHGMRAITKEVVDNEEKKSKIQNESSQMDSNNGLCCIKKCTYHFFGKKPLAKETT